MSTLCICAYRGGGGLTDGHAWIEYSNDAGETHSWGTWGNRDPIGLHRDLEMQYQELGAYQPKTCCCVALSAERELAFLVYLETDEATAWGSVNNCASFAARAWRAAGLGEINPSNWVGIPNPNSLADAIREHCAGIGGTLSGDDTARGALFREPSGSLGSSSHR